MIKIISADRYIPEKEYVFDVIFNDFLGIEYSVEYRGRDASTFIFGENGSIEIPEVFFAIDDSKWLTKDSLPMLPLNIANIKIFKKNYEHMPIIYGRTNYMNEYIHIEKDKIFFGIDVFGSVFFMLSRYEEYVLIQYRDSHDRFPAKMSVAYKCGFLDRAIVNEYVEMLWELLSKISSNLIRKKRSFELISTHDIDKPFGMLYDSPIQIIRHLVGDLLFRKSINQFLIRIKDIYKMIFRKKIYIGEKMETFYFILEQSKKHKLRDIFFFMNSKCSLRDGNYTIDSQDVIMLIKKIVKYGHFIGIHPSYISYDNGLEIRNEVMNMNAILSRNKFPKIVGGRQHYLRWKNPDTWQFYEDACIPFDSSMTYAASVGFRSGVCYPYHVYNLHSRKKLALIERPLIVMDGSLYEYMKLSHEEAMHVIKKLANECKKYDGEFIILWHNTMLDNMEERYFYKRVLDEVCSK